MTKLVDLLATYVPADAPEVEACRAALARSEAAIAPSATGYECHAVLVFICVATKE